MFQRINAFGIGQTAKVMGALYALMGVVLMPIFLLIALFSPEGAIFGFGMAILAPLLYGVMGFLAGALMCAIYNFVAGRVGGIEIKLDSAESR
jgi:hypothetical protein